MVDRHSDPFGQGDAEIAELFRRAMTAHRSGQLADAEPLYRRVLALDGKHVPSLQMLGLLCAQAGNFSAAERLFADALQINPNDSRCHFNRGNALALLNRLDEALDEFGKAATLDPVFAEAHLNRGSILLRWKRFEEALASYDGALRANPNYADAHCNRGNALEQLKRFDEALASIDRALALAPRHAEFHASRGNALYRLARLNEALASLDAAIAINPDAAEFHDNRGNILLELKRPADAFAAYDRALRLKSDLDYVEGNRLFAKMLICDWSNLDAECAHLVEGVTAGKLVSRPFGILAMPVPPAVQSQCVKLFMDHDFPAAPSLCSGQCYRHERIRLAYLSADFRSHPVAHLLAGVLERHDRARFETMAVSFGPADASPMRQRLQAAFERFIDVCDKGDAEVARLLREAEVDIAIDLMGPTQNARPAILAHRPAPVQAIYLGYLGTMGAQYIDYIIADQIVIPENQREFYSEKIVYLPNSFQPNDQERRISDKIFTRAEVGLPQQGFVFCCFNNSYKITPDVFDIWMRILKQVRGSVLWLVGEGPTIERNLKSEAMARGVAAERLIFAPRLPVPEYLARLRLADLFLDTLPYNAGTTASDALWAGLPVLTRIGETFAARMAASLLNAIGLSELVTTTPHDYEALAVALATQADTLTAIKKKLADNRLTTSLFDTALFTKHIEAAYTAMVERHQAGLAPDHIFVPN